MYINVLNHLYALNGATGSQKWNVNFDLNSTPVSVDNAGTVYAIYSKAGDPATYLGAFNGQNGGKLWEYATSPFGGDAGPPIIGPDGILYLSDVNEGLIAVQ